MSFVLRIFFSGLIAFAPSPDGKQLTVLLVNADGYHLSDGTSLEAHQPMLLARAGSCTGECPTRDLAIARFLFPDKPAEALDALAIALSGGGGWLLADADLSLHAGGPGDGSFPEPLVLQGGARKAGNLPAVPLTAQEREDFAWVADLKQICPSAGGLDPAVLAARPPKGLIAARLQLRSGKVFTYSLIRIGDMVKPVHFKPLGANGTGISYAQALANWVAAEIQVPGDTVELVEESFGGGARRSMTLSPGPNGVVEMAILNLPALHPPAAPATGESAAQQPPASGKHFELYFELAKMPPAKSVRPIPQVLQARPAAGSEPEIAWETLHPLNGTASDLLDKLRLGLRRGPYDRVLCPMIQFSGGGS